jgi:hypothetical protein
LGEFLPQYDNCRNTRALCGDSIVICNCGKIGTNKNMRANSTVLTLFILTLTVTLHAQVLLDTIKTIKSITEYKITFNDSLYKNDTTLTRESKYDSLGQLTEERAFENNKMVSFSYKNSDGTWGGFGIYSLDSPCETETITKRTKDSQLIEEEYWGDCIWGKVYYKKVYIYFNNTDYLRQILKYNSEGTLTETTLYVNEYY